MRKLTLIFVFFVALSLFLLGNVALAADWQKTTVDATGFAGDGTSIMIDSMGYVHIAYLGDSKLKYTTNSSGSWQVTIIDESSVMVGGYPALVIDSNNKIHIVYYDASNDDLKYATNMAGNWGNSVLDSTGGSFVDMAIDSNNYLHVSYYNGSKVKYAVKTTTWAYQDVETIVTTSTTSIAVDSNGKMHISYYDDSNQWLKYATNESGSFLSSAIDSGGVGQYSSIAVDANNKVHISYYNGGVQALMYITNISGTWQKTTVDVAVLAGGLTGIHSSLSLDKNGKAHISYHDGYPSYSLKYATNISGSWQKYTIDQGNSSLIFGFQTSIKVDELNRIHISYQDHINGDLKYAAVLGPINSNLIINSNKVYTALRTIALSIFASGNPVQMIISENSNFTGASWEAYDASKIFTLSKGDGTKTVYISFRDQWYAESSALLKSIRYIKNPKFVTKRARKINEVLLKKEGKKYLSRDLNLTVTRYPKKLKKSKYFILSKLYSNHFKKVDKNKMLKKYWLVTSDLNKYSSKKSKNSFKLKIVFSYTKKEFKKLKKSQKIKQSELKLLYFDKQKKKWKNSFATHDVEGRTFTLVIDSPIVFLERTFGIGIK